MREILTHMGLMTNTQLGHSDVEKKLRYALLCVAVCGGVLQLGASVSDSRARH